MNKKSLKVGMILDQDFPPDDRPEKEALSLINAGYEVHLLCYTATQKALKENYKGIKITRFHLNEKIHKKFSAAYLVLPIYRWIWKYQIQTFVKRNRIDIIHMHDLPMTDIVINVSHKFGIKVVCDQHEFWSEWIGNTAHYNTALGKIVKFLSNWKKYELSYLTKADLVITVEEPLRQLYITERGIDPKKIITVPNTPLKKIFNMDNISSEILSRYKDHFVIFYVGKIDILRGIDTIINALPQLVEVIQNIKFVIAGQLALNCDPLKMAKKLNVDHFIEYLGWLPIEEFPSYITASSICVFTPHTENEEINNTIATKIYQYTAMKKPIIVSEARLMKEFVEKNDIGFSIKSDNSNEFKEKVEYIYLNYPEYSKKVADNCSTVIQKQSIFWEKTVHQLTNFYTTNFLPDQNEG